MVAVVAACMAAMPVRAADAPGKPRLYAFFATWCVPCRAELPSIDRIRRLYADKGLDVVLVSLDSPSSASEVAGSLAQIGIETSWILDPESELLVRYQPSGSIPFTVLLDPAGNPVFARSGYEPGDEARLEAEVVKLLAARVAAAAAPPAKAADAGAPVSASLAVRTVGTWRHSRFERRGDGDLGALVARFEPQVRSGWVAASARMDSATLVGRTAGDTFDLRLERALLDLDRGAVRVRLGDNYVRVGQGMTLSLRRVDPLGTDTALRGGRVDVSGGPLRVTGIAGVVNRQNLDPIDLVVVADVDDLIAAGEVEVRPLKGLALDAYAVAASLPGAAPDGSDVTWVLGGGSVAVEAGPVRVAAEGAGGQREGRSTTRDTPHGLTGSVAVDAGPVSLLGEAKWYRRWGLGRPTGCLAYGEPATLERSDQQIPGNADSVGGRGRVDWRVAGPVTVFGNGLYYRFAIDGRDPVDGGRVWHAYGGTDVRLAGGTTLMLSGGYRDEDDAAGEDAVTLWHVEADALVPLPARLAIAARVSHVSERKVAFDVNDFVRGLATLGLAWTGVGSVSLLYGWSDEVATRPTHYPGAEAKVVLPMGGEVRLFGGRIAGGRVCVSGTCRDLAPFSGVRLDASLRF